MQRLMKFSLLVLAMAALLLLTACLPASTPGGANCQEGICVDIQLSEPIRFNEPVTATVTVETEQDTPRLGVSLWSQYSVIVEGTDSWRVDTKAHQPVNFIGTVRFTQEGYFDVIGAITTYDGLHIADSAPVHISRAGGTLNPVSPTGPAIAVPQPTIAGGISPIPTPSPLTKSSLAPSASQWVLVTGQDFEGAFPPAGWIARDLNTDGKEIYWGKTSYRTVSGSGAVWPARGGAQGVDPALSATHDYTNNLNTGLIYGPFDLSDAVLAQAQFQLWREIELNYDYLAVEASHDGVTFQTVVTWTGNSTTWAVNTARYDDYLGDNSVWTTWRFYSDASVTRDGPYVDDIYLWKYVPGQVAARGTFAYADRAGQSQPARFVRVYLYDADPGGDDDLLTQTTTDANGYFEFPLIRNWDTDVVSQTSTTGRLDLYIQWETSYDDSATAQRRVVKFNDQTYQWRSSAIQSDAPDGIVSFNDWVPLGDNQRGAMLIFQDLRRGWEYVNNNANSDPGSATARWEDNQNSYSICGGSCFSPSFGIFIDDIGINVPDAVVHELGHQYMYNARGAWFTSCANHRVFNSISVECGYIEGWADFFPLIVNNDSCYDTRTGPCEGTPDTDYYNLETHARADGLLEGDAVEGRVAGAMYDLFDTTNEGFDHATFDFSPIWNVVSTVPVVGGSSFADFWNNWKAKGYNQHPAVQALFQSSIDYDSTPIIANLPDRAALENLPLMGAADLWDYSFDQESADAELTWIITSNTGGCGATIRDHFVDVFPPQNWQGISCDITVQVSDGIKTDQDMFNVHTVPIVARSFLPLILKSATNPLQSPPVTPSPFASPLPVPVQPNPFVSPLSNPVTS